MARLTCLSGDSFVFLWVGTGAADGLERGREVLAKWGFRRCEDIVCVSVRPDQTSSENGNMVDTEDKTKEHSSSEGEAAMHSNHSGLTRTIQHCLMGIRGTVRRSVDTNFVHCNIDTDVILWSPSPPPLSEGTEEKADEGEGNSAETAGIKDRQTSSLASDLRKAQAIKQKMHSKPPELYSIIENFCQGTRRIELFGTNANLRPGWLTVGLSLGPDQPGWPGPQEEKPPAPWTEEQIVAAQQAGEGAGIPEGSFPNSLMDGPSGLSSQANVQSEARKQEPRPYVKDEYDSYFAVDPPGCELKDRANVLPYDHVVDTLRPKSPPPTRRNKMMNSKPPPRNFPSGPTALSYGPLLTGSNTTSSTSRLSGPPGSGGLLPRPGEGAGLPPRPSFTPASPALGLPPFMPKPQHVAHSPATAGAGYAPVPAGGGAGLSGLGAGGARTVSVPSGSDTLSGPQASVLGLRTPSALGAPHGLGRR